MPNHVSNTLKLIGHIDDIDELLNLIRNYGEGTLFDFEKVIPMPDNIYRGDFGREEEKLYGKNNWYD
jgi:hypothetical protein